MPVDYVHERLERADGHELNSGKFVSKESSSALAVNTFAWFHDCPQHLPPFGELDQQVWRPILVDVEYCARFPWRGGRHPWLDAWIETPTSIIGVESKRFEPYRGKRKDNPMSPAYDRPVWHERMSAYEALRDRLRSGVEHFEILDAVQLLKHAFGLVTEGRRKTKRPYLVYLYAEPADLGGVPITDSTKQAHRAEIARFKAAISGDEVSFSASSYREWLETWPNTDLRLREHRLEIMTRFQP